MVQHWYNLNAENDAVGGSLAGYYEIDQEFLDLPSRCPDSIELPVCAHHSYFQQQNVEVNRDLFAKFIKANV